MILKIGRYEYKIDGGDLFMDNGACIQLLTQSKENSRWGHRATPVLSLRAIREINEYKRNPQKHSFGEGVQVFCLGL